MKLAEDKGEGKRLSEYVEAEPEPNKTKIAAAKESRRSTLGGAQRPSASRRRSSIDMEDGIDLKQLLMPAAPAKPTEDFSGIRESVKHRRRSCSWGPGDFRCASLRPRPLF